MGQKSLTHNFTLSGKISLQSWIFVNASESYHVIHPSTYSFCVESYLKKGLKYGPSSNITILWKGHCAALVRGGRS